MTRFPNLVELTVAFPNTTAVGSELGYVFRTLPKLERLTITVEFLFSRQELCLHRLRNSGGFVGDSEVVEPIHNSKALTAFTIAASSSIGISKLLLRDYLTYAGLYRYLANDRISETLKVVLLYTLGSLSDTHIDAVTENCRNLETLGIKYCDNVTRDRIRAFSGHKCLKYLAVLINVNFRLREVFVDRSGLYPRFLTRYPNLVNLELQFRPITTNDGSGTDGDLEYVSQACPKLESITFDAVDFLDDLRPQKGYLLGLGKGFRKLSHVEFVGNFVDSEVVEVIHPAPNLKSIVFKSNSSIAINEVLRVIGDASSIGILELGWCDEITDAGLSHLANGAISKTLKKFVIRNFQGIDDNGVRLLFNMRSLEHLEFDCCRVITDVGIIGISKIKTLEVLMLGFLDHISDSCIVAVAKNCHNLEIFELKHCENVGVAGISAFSGHKCLKCLVLIDLNFSEADLENVILELPPDRIGA